jgi:hypothetical protein
VAPGAAAHVHRVGKHSELGNGTWASRPRIIGGAQWEATLARYYFHLYDNDVLRDQTGEELADEDAAHQAALCGISELIAETIVEGKLVDLAERIEVADEKGEIVTTVRFSDLFLVDPPDTKV